MLAALAVAAALGAAGSVPVEDFGGMPSPNGKWVLFTRSYPHSRYEQRIATLVVRVDGTHVRTIIASGAAGSACWTSGGLVAIGDGVNATLVEPRTGAVVQGEASCATAQSPDGRLRAYTSGGTLYVSRTDGSGAHSVATSPDGSFHSVSWSADSARLAYAIAASPKAYALELVDPGGTNRVRVELSVSGFMVSWAPDGTRLAFSAQAGGSEYHPPHVYIVAANGTGLRLFDGGDARSPSWSPRGGLIAYDRVLHLPGRDVEQVVLVRPDGTGLRVLRGVLAGHAWLPSGTRLVVTARGTCTRTGIFTIGRDGTQARRLTNRC